MNPSSKHLLDEMSRLFAEQNTWLDQRFAASFAPARAFRHRVDRDRACAFRRRIGHRRARTFRHRLRHAARSSTL
jgi:hypothetical protein